MPGDIFDWYAAVNRRIISAHVAYVAETFETLLRPTASTVGRSTERYVRSTLWPCR